MIYRIEAGGHAGVGSETVHLETARISDPERRARVQEQANLFTEMVSIAQEQAGRGRFLETLGFKPLDALHIACAEQEQAVVLLIRCFPWFAPNIGVPTTAHVPRFREEPLEATLQPKFVTAGSLVSGCLKTSLIVSERVIY